MNYYSVYYKDKLLGEYTAPQAADIAKCKLDTVYRAALTNKAVGNCFRFVKLDSDSEILEKEWNKTRLSILNAKPKITTVKVVKPFSIWKENDKTFLRKTKRAS